MVLSTHAVVGAAVAAGAGLPVLPAFFVGWLTHYLLDAIPHWDYSFSLKDHLSGKRSVQYTRLTKDIFKLSIDLFLVICAVVLVSYISGQGFFVLAVAAGAFGAMVPDGLQLVHAIFPRQPLIVLDRIHVACHSGRSLHDSRIGLISQFVLGVSALGILVLIFMA